MTKKKNTLFYKKAIDRYGISAQGVHWNSEFSQYKRFEVLTSFIENSIKESTIIDAGCGFGEYYNYLFDNNLKPKSYLGIDCEEQMIKLASKRFLNTKFEVQDILNDSLLNSDYYICSGAMNLLKKEEVFTFIEKCFNASNKAFIFNFIKNDSLTNVKYSDIMDFSSKLSKQMLLKEDYLSNDFSIYLKK